LPVLRPFAAVVETDLAGLRRYGNRFISLNGVILQQHVTDPSLIEGMLVRAFRAMRTLG